MAVSCCLTALLSMAPETPKDRGRFFLDRQNILVRRKSQWCGAIFNVEYAWLKRGV
jgi:hypothetical protein